MVTVVIANSGISISTSTFCYSLSVNFACTILAPAGQQNLGDKNYQTYKNTFKLGGGDNPMGTHKSQNQGPWPPKPDTYDRYKVFCQKDHILSIKKKRVPSNITFWIFRPFWPIGSHWEKRNQPIKMMANELLSID